MTAFLAILVPFLFYWILLFVACFAVVEFGQTYLYDEATPGATWKVALASAVLAAIVTWSRPEYTTMFTRDLRMTILLGIVTFGLFTLLLGFQPWHALPIGLVTVMLVSGIATMGVESFANRNRPLPAATRTPSQPIRRATGGVQSLTPLPATKPAAK